MIFLVGSGCGSRLTREQGRWNTRVTTNLWTSIFLGMTLGCAGGGGPGSAEKDHQAHEAPHWGYGRDNGPEHWGRLNADWALCSSGTSQSPIDLHFAEPGSELDPVTLNLPRANLRIIHQEHVLDALDNGHTIQVNVDDSDTLTIGEQSFDLVQYHFHAPSEHSVDGEHYPMEMHLVHQSAAGELAVVGVFIAEGEHNAAFDPVWNNMPIETGAVKHIENVNVDIDDMLPSDLTSWRYQGSLTTPPCSEDVRWIVLQTPIQLGSGQIQQFKNLFTGNNRPTQALNGRSIATGSPRVE